MTDAQNNPLDPEHISYVAMMLNIGKFKLFENAYHAWYGFKAKKNIIDPYYKKYQVDNSVPFWVRNYVRSVINSSNIRKQTQRYNFGDFLSVLLPPIIVLLVMLYVLLWGN